MARYFKFDPQALEEFLTARKFYRTVRSNEVVYVREHSRDPNVKMAVYTTIANDSTSCRKCGADAIRVCSFYENAQTGKSFGLVKSRRILRTTSQESIHERLAVRMREVAIEANSRMRWR